MSTRSSLERLNCSLAQALGQIGDAWTLMILRDAFLGLSRFGEFKRSLGLASNILADRLAAMVQDGLLVRSGSEARPTYTLSERGRELLPALAALMQWGDRWISRDGPPMLLVDQEGHSLPEIVLKGADGAQIDASQVSFAAGPGATPETRAFLDARGHRLRRTTAS